MLRKEPHRDSANRGLTQSLGLASEKALVEANQVPLLGLQFSCNESRAMSGSSARFWGSALRLSFCRFRNDLANIWPSICQASETQLQLAVPPNGGPLFALLKRRKGGGATRRVDPRRLTSLLHSRRSLGRNLRLRDRADAREARAGDQGRRQENSSEIRGEYSIGMLRWGFYGVWLRLFRYALSITLASFAGRIALDSFLAIVQRKVRLETHCAS